MKSNLLFAVLLFVSAAVAAPWAPPAYLERAVVYQLVLRNCTRDGNFKAAAKMLPHVRSLGVDVVYVTPFVEMDRDMDESGWSPRQVKSGFRTPKNPYRISDYDKIDPEYGTDADFRAFNAEAHRLGMKTYMDLVYLHCGPNNVLKDKFPDAFQRHPDGSVRTTQWHFPYVNFASKEVRKYLIGSMKHWIALGCDGFRCDVGDQVPIDFWQEAAAACRAVKPDLVMINEGTKAEWLEKAFDACYAWPFSFTIRAQIAEGRDVTCWDIDGTNLVQRMAHVRKYESGIPPNALMFCFMDNHDTAADDWENRFDRVLPVEAGNAAFTLMFLRRGLPLVFNGNEIADDSLNTFFAPVEDVARARKTVDWARALQPEGQKRLAHLRALAKLRHEHPAFGGGAMRWLTGGETNGVVAFTRMSADGKSRMLVAANLSSKTTEADFRAEGVAVSPAAERALGDAVVKADGTLAFKPWDFLVVELAASAAEAPKARTVMNVVNFVRGCEPRDPEMDLVKPIAEEIALNTKHHLPNTILLQYDAMIRPDLMKVVKTAEPDKTEYGVWIEMARQLVEKVGLAWRGRKGWDWDWFINPGFLMAYSHEERAKIIDEIFREFKSHFGYWPKSVGSWLLDAWSMDYMQKKYDVKGFCICREQDNTDAYGLRGGYFNGLYYPSRKNMLSAAVDMKNAVKAPVFKMLTPDPIYNYAKSVTPKGVESVPCTLEPVWYSGFTKAVVDWYFRVYTGPGMLNLSYMQTGQENSFGWGMIGKGLPYQIEVIARMAKDGRIDVEKMCDTAERFIREHPENCPQTQVALEDWGGDRKSVWYNSKHYRANLFLAGGVLSFRDVHKMCDGFEEPFLDKVCTGWQALYFTPPVLDEYLFKTDGRFKPVTFPGRFTEIKVETPNAETLVATAKGEGVADVRVTFTPGKIAVQGVPETLAKSVKPGVHVLDFDGYKYQVGVTREGDIVEADLSLPEVK